jgi:PAS domain S-box-containing protein
METYFETAFQPLIAVSRDGTIQLVNQRTADLFGYSVAELKGRTVEILLPERYRAAHSGHLARYFEAPSERPMGIGRDLTGARKDGSEFPVEIALRWVQSGDDLLGIGVVVDITERKRVESELARVNAELVRSNAELAQFAYVASHDLQEPLRMISSYLQLVKKRYNHKLDDDGREFIAYAVDGATRMKSLIHDLLRFSRAGTQAVHLQEVDADQLLQVACSNLKMAIVESRAKITSGTLPTVFADSGLLTQVFQNLIGNAIKFRAAGTNPEIQISARRTELGWVFSVSDNGIGIEPQYTARIFRIFERLHGVDDYGGSGVGLAISQRIVERHGGKIWVESQPSQGSTFSFSIPVRARDRGEKKAAGSALS